MIIKQACIGFITYFIAIIFNLGVTISSKSDVITFLSIIIGFFLSAIAILYASPLRKLLNKETAKDYPNKWLSIVNSYKNVTIYSFVVIFYLLIDFSDLSRYQIIWKGYKIFEYEKFILSLLSVAVYSLIILLLRLFKNLSVPVND
ncbi:hypothetical protein [Lactococcus garvieae]|uniref:hypothetical protein n=1 Tax=Lactococcus garvieae TaxID=1363 RepID=UPI00289133CB|nr:hypothetical protein [Lactococcus garvieae]MDT2741779.1 hypothetical protein [Lactococcus garvieae]